MDTTALPPSDVISVEYADHIATVWLDRPRKLNAMAPNFWTEFPAIIEAVSDQDDVRVIVIAAKGRVFTAGLDLAEFAGLFAVADDQSMAKQNRALYQQIKLMQHTFTVLDKARQPVIAAIHGACIGAGMDLITAVDIRFAAANAKFAVRETKIAITADVGTLQRLPRIINRGEANELALTGRDFDAREALRIGLVSKVLADYEEVYTHAMAVGAEIAANSPLVVQGTKAVMKAGDDMSVDQALDYIALWNSSFLKSHDIGEAMNAFKENRAPSFKGE
ncbi:MAG: crotonase/enoyl-CoA hydratase family protein [Acidobacteria bacterium]|nr:crotonase/enoyl-CoA hydratase family protein [Acidobacteriota bacterium]MCH8986134.1 crotonase/enoyl-CoA hydratase family protein [Acidobacteriota bacterium]